MRYLKPLLMLALSFAVFAGILSEQARADTLEQIKKAGVIHFATGVMGLKPWMWQTPDGEYHGIDADIAKEVAKRLGVKLDIIVTEWSTLIPGERVSRWDVFIASMMKSEERMIGGGIQFSDPYILSYILVCVLQDSPIKNMADLKGKEIAAGNGSADALVAQSLVDQGLAGSVKLYETFNQTFVALQNKQVDALVTDQNTLIAQRDQLVGLHAVSGPLHFIAKPDWAAAQEKANYILGGYAIGVRKDDNDLREAINKILDDMNKDGTRKQILEKYGVWTEEQVHLFK